MYSLLHIAMNELTNTGFKTELLFVSFIIIVKIC